MEERKTTADEKLIKENEELKTQLFDVRMRLNDLLES